MVFALRPVDKHFQLIKAHFHIAVRGLCLLLSVNAYIDFIQTLFGQGNRVAIAEDGIGTLIVLIPRLLGETIKSVSFIAKSFLTAQCAIHRLTGT